MSQYNFVTELDKLREKAEIPRKSTGASTVPPEYRGTTVFPLDPPKQQLAVGAVRRFESGATRSSDEGKPDYEGFLSPLVIHRYGEYMSKHRVQEDGSVRPSDNWTKGIPRRQYLKSGWRHLTDVWLITRGWGNKATNPNLEESLCAVLFNVMGYLHEVLIGRDCGQQNSAA